MVSSTYKFKTGLLLNPHSGKAKKCLKEIRKLILKLPGVDFREAANQKAINQATEYFIEQKMELVVIIGGDGTVRAVLNHYFSRSNISSSPQFLVVPGGTTNMTAKDIGVFGSPIKTLKQLNSLILGEHSGTVVNKSVLRISQDTRPDVYGMFFGIGIITVGTKFFRKHVKSLGITGEFASFIAIINLAFKLLVSRKNKYSDPINVQFDCDPSNTHQLSCLLLFVSTLDRLLFGVRPYWGIQHEPLHCTYIKKCSSNFWRSVFGIILNNSRPLMEEDGYYSSNNKNLSLLIDGDFVVDGEIFYADSNHGALHLSPTEPVSFIVP